MDTIFALATAQGRAGVAVIRISGLQAFDVAGQLVDNLPAPRRAGARVLRDKDGAALDRVLVLVFAGPASFTGEDVVEFQMHGSIAVVNAVLRALGDGPARLAEPGEFTRRALENDKMDLTQVEGLGDLIAAETEAQRRQALRTAEGALSKTIEIWRGQLIRAAALIEATIDFADEEVPEDVTPEVHDLLTGVQSGISIELKGFSASERIRSGFEVAIVGPPNVGKSTLLNALARRDAAITSHIAGTTRDVIEVRMDLGGLPVTLLDTAGLRESDDEVEAEGVSRAISRARASDIRIFLRESGEDLAIEPVANDIVLTPKADLRTDDSASVSGLTGQGIGALINQLTKILSERVQGAGLATHARHKSSMEASIDTLSHAIASVEGGPERYDIAAEEIRAAIRSLEAVVGRIDVENLLDEIFSSFCLGK